MEKKKEMNLPRWSYHIVALIIVIIWGTTFVSTKVLLNSGLTADEVCLFRFLIAYIGLWIFGPKQLWTKSYKEEFLFMLMGFTGGAMYFLTENNALKLLSVSDVTFLTSGTPVFLAIILSCFFKSEKTFGLYQWFFSVLAFLGVGVVVYAGMQNDSNVHNFSLLGVVLALASSLSWCLYSIIVKCMKPNYSIVLASRKIFFYGSLFILPFFITNGHNVDWSIFEEFSIWSNILFLGLIASMLCYSGWIIVVKEIGVIKTTNYIYVTPIISIITALKILNEPISLLAAMGAAVVLFSVYMMEVASRKKNI